MVSGLSFLQRLGWNLMPPAGEQRLLLSLGGGVGVGGGARDWEQRPGAEPGLWRDSRSLLFLLPDPGPAPLGSCHNGDLGVSVLAVAGVILHWPWFNIWNSEFASSCYSSLISSLGVNPGALPLGLINELVLTVPFRLSASRKSSCCQSWPLLHRLTRPL